MSVELREKTRSLSAERLRGNNTFMRTISVSEESDNVLETILRQSERSPY